MRSPIPRTHGGDPLDAFDVIVPSLPGYGFSGPPIREDGSSGPIGSRAIAGLWHTLVHETLNYRRPYGVQGGDWGAVVSSWAAFDHPLKDEKDDWKSGVVGLHLNMMGLRPVIDLQQVLAQRLREGLARQGPERARREDRLPARPVARPQTLRARRSARYFVTASLNRSPSPRSRRAPARPPPPRS